MKFKDCRIIPSKPVRETSFFKTYPVLHHDMLLGAKIAREKQDDYLLKQNAASQMPLVHPNIVPVFEIGWCEDDGITRPFALTKYFDTPSMSELISGGKNLSLEQKLELGFKMIDALKYAHSKGRLHCNLNEDNILADTGTVFLDDFGACKEPFYAAPEYEKNKKMSEKTDVFALAHCLYNLISGKLSKYANAQNVAVWPESIHSVFEKGLAIKPEERISTEGMEKALDDVMKEYRAFLMEISVDSTNCLDIALEHKRRGDSGSAKSLFEMAAVFFRNEVAIEELSRIYLNDGEFNSAVELVKENELPGVQKNILEYALIKSAGLSKQLVKEFSFDTVMGAYAGADPSDCSVVRKKMKNSLSTDNDVAIAVSIEHPEKAISIFESLLDTSDNNVIFNNMGAAAALAGNPNASEYLEKSSLETAALNRALFSFSNSDYQSAVRNAEKIRHIPKAGAVVRAVGRKAGFDSGMKKHPAYASELLTGRISERFVREGIMPHDYEFERL